jgi:hypothetical protein
VPIPRSSSSDTGPNIVCLLDSAYDELNDAECALIQRGNTADLAPDQTRDPFTTGGIYDGEKPDGLPWQAESCIVPEYYIDGSPTNANLLPEDMLALFGMFSRVTGGGSDHTLPLYYVILANAMQGRTSFTHQTDEEVLATLSTMSPSQYVFAGKCGAVLFVLARAERTAQAVWCLEGTGEQWCTLLGALCA